MENNIAKYKWTKPPNVLLEMHKQMHNIENKINVNNNGKVNPNDMKMAKENYAKLLEIESKINKNKLNNEMKKILNQKKGFTTKYTSLKGKYKKTK